MNIETATDPLETIVHIGLAHDDDTRNGETILKLEAVTAAHYRPPESRETQMKRHTAVENEDKERHNQDWKYKVDIGPSYEHLRPQIVDILSELTCMWNRRLGTKITARNRVFLDPPTAKPVL